MDGDADTTLPPIVTTNTAQCRDCYRCVRVCPVKAIAIKDGQASVDPDRCVSCGACVRECPQRAKTYRSDIAAVQSMLADGGPVAISVAPSFAGLNPQWRRNRLPSVLRQLGFTLIEETSSAALGVARRTAELLHGHPGQPIIASACPAAVNYIERYHSDCIDWLAAVPSPMLAHARSIRKRFGPNMRIVFLGPCVAKKDEAQRKAIAGEIDAVLTFEEFNDWIRTEQIDPASCEESGFDNPPTGAAAMFPLAGGSLRTAEVSSDLLATDTISVHGFEDIRDAIAAAKTKPRPVIIEALFCRHGCINGPGADCEANCFQRRLNVLEYHRTLTGKDSPTTLDPADQAGTEVQFDPHPVADTDDFTEAQIRAVLERIGKTSPEDELNCGACGYDTCRDKAKAVLAGLAEPEMCIPYMRRLAEQRTDRIIETSPNGIVILDHERKILSMNPAFRKMFMCSDGTAGKTISTLMDPSMFERLADPTVDMLESIVRHDAYGVVCHQVAYALRSEQQYVGIFVNITNLQENAQQLDLLRERTVEKARELLDHQISMAQQIAEFLGRSTADGEELLENLLQMARKPEKPTASTQPGRANKWNGPTYMSR